MNADAVCLTDRAVPQTLSPFHTRSSDTDDSLIPSVIRIVDIPHDEAPARPVRCVPVIGTKDRHAPAPQVIT
jgi:hypothetical protein